MRFRTTIAAAAIATATWTVPASAATYKQIYAFQGGADGALPGSRLLHTGGLLYGTTVNGGAGYGTIFSIDPTTGTKTTLYKFNPNKVANDGAFPRAALITLNGVLYGTTQYGGSSPNCTNGCGTVFSFNPSTGTAAVVYSFTGGADGYSPLAGLVGISGTLYGTTLLGGTGTCVKGCGTVFSYRPATGVKKTVYSFQATGLDGVLPYGALTNVQGTLWGTTSRGGVFGQGTVFSVNPNTGAESVIHSFNLAVGDGAYPHGSLTNSNTASFTAPPVTAARSPAARARWPAAAVARSSAFR